MVSACPQIFKSSSHFIQSLGIIPIAPDSNDITTTFMLHSFFLVL